MSVQIVQLPKSFSRLPTPLSALHGGEAEGETKNLISLEAISDCKIIQFLNVLIKSGKLIC
jgi:hypothetical protein